MKIYLRKTVGNMLVPDDEESTESLKKIKHGTVVSVELKQPRNYKFLKKFMAMIRIGFDAWEPPHGEYKGHPTQKNIKRFRKDVTIAAGFYDVTVNLKGETRLEAKSISFSEMNEEEFGKVYSAVADVLLQRVLRMYKREDLDRVVNELAGFVSGDNWQG